MQVMRDSASIRGSVTDPTLAPLIARLIDDLSDYDCDLSQMVHIVVIDPGDALMTIDAELGFQLLDRPLDVIEAHPGWFELTYVLSDDGFGVVVYVPVRPGVDARLIEHCRESIQ
ncbi:hypothetical protein [Hydrogenophaga sp. 2FB]|uniref:hypothetical protein n=1 Tax=Hydrogenophaga sp. 2FB TaxID=2502187 RepID=UPI0010FA066A|nr:hypothetical protein [Hydrogenophaga sp. 2FB]